ncbi:hypothetical protein B0H14DRAFT_3141849 [Mycena olivaceomarginata]|nr:hypothetical protein B0H14DRAFT_3141849 [Mycena olivaceomarginata]
MEKQRNRDQEIKGQQCRQGFDGCEFEDQDVQLKARGDTTNINYEARFEEYLDILLTGLRKKTPSILNVFSEWDRIIFPDAKASHFDPERKTGKSDGYKRAMEAMRAEEPVSSIKFRAQVGA